MEETVLMSEKASTSTPDIRFVCRVCQKQFSQYTCPRCNCRYCSLQCYKSHSLRCTESFMRENVVGELRQLQPEEETKRKMLDILKQFHQGEETDPAEEDDSCMISEETIQKVLSGKQVSLEDLNPEELKQFRRAVASGELSKMVEPWKPWWSMPSARTISLSSDGTQLVRPVHDEQQQDAIEGSFNEIPPGPETPLVPICKMIRTEPSPLLIFHLIDILYAYCFTLRLYNGDWHNSASDAAMVALGISLVLGKDGQPQTVAAVLAYSMEQTCSAPYRHASGLRFGLILIDDFISLLSLGENALVCALCDLQRLIDAGEKEIKSEKRRREKCETNKLRHADWKLNFMMCWVHEQPQEVWLSLSSIVASEKTSLAALETAVKHLPTKRGKNKGEGLIEEVK